MEEPDGATPLDPDERAGLKFPHIQTRGELDQVEQVNIQDGLRWLKKQKNPDVLTEAFIRRLHKEMLGEVWEWAGTFRNTEKNIGVAPEQIAVQLRNLLDDVQFWIDNETYLAKEIGLRFHHRLVQIHLFANGNGRHARIMTDVVLTKVMNEKTIHWGDVNLQDAGKHRDEYIAALRQADAGNYQPLLEKFSMKE
tara:strand:- start:9755 stop:10339 length:585 start_codon:yes stop_codon:yes gene_type:complete